MHYKEAVARACQEPTLAAALSWIAVWETERAIGQVRTYDKTGVSTASHGGSHDTHFLLYFKEVLNKYGGADEIALKCTKLEGDVRRLSLMLQVIQTIDDLHITGYFPDDPLVRLTEAAHKHGRKLMNELCAKEVIDALIEAGEDPRAADSLATRLRGLK